ncbi:hypothetical protein K2P96_00255 [Patescibacteria group bacterium]|nr:hypothetical protein [Patescibacteria group bacterium]
MEILGKILGTPARVKIMRLFLLNRGKWFETNDLAKRCQVGRDSARREIRLLASVGFIKHRGKEWSFNSSFKYSREMEDLLVNSENLNTKSIADYFKKVGRIKFFLVSGIFIKDKDSRLDLLIVGDKIKRAKTEEAVRKLEAEIGKELTYAVFETKEFIYRFNMYDKLVRDILDFPHDVVLETKELSTLLLKKS